MRLIRTNEGAGRLEELIDNDPGGSLTFEVPTREGAEVLVGLDGGPSVPAKAQDTGHTASLRIAARASSRYPAGAARRRVWYRLLREQLLHLRVAQLILLPAGLCIEEADLSI